ncbi:hypothetical protein GN244_ATG19725 [Phytophthora infestans]|uniref:Uncharacterized protein n=1 Tax=Phytophthora infestans TaxID=4787 RepID=A0A833S3X4_PHYIN|nr:hypothetical protein GN244_ATG19725 [Phytophthora infestans]
MSDVGSELDVAGDTRSLDAEEIDRLRLVLSNLEALYLTEAVAVFATRTDRRQSQNMEQIKAKQALLHEVINQIQSFADEEMAKQKTDLASLGREMDALRQGIQMQKPTSQNVDQSVSSHGYRNEEELYVEWDVVGSSPPNAPSFTNLELKSRVSMYLKQKETPVYGGTEDDDIDVYVLNMISWNRNEVALQDYKGERRWNHIVKKMKQRFVTRSREEDLVVSFFDCNQGNTRVIGRTVRCGPIINPRDVPAEKPTGSQNLYPGSNKKAGAFKNKSNELDGVSRPNIASTNAQNRVFDPGTKANYMYFQSGNGEKKLAPERYLIKTVRCEKDTISAAARAFFDKGADFCGVSEEFVEQQGWMKGVVDHGAMQVTYDNGKTVS